MRRPRLTYSNVSSTLALFIALGGTGYALTIPRDSVRSEQIAANAVRSSELAARSVGSAEIRRSAVHSAEVLDGSLRAVDLAEGVLPGLRWAHVAGDGSIIAQSGGISLASHANGTGAYYLDFGAPVVDKALIATASDKDLDFGGTVLATPCGGGTQGIVCTAPGTDTNEHAFIFTSNEANTGGKQHAFYVLLAG